MPFVVDASVALAWFLPGEASDTAIAALRRLDADTALAPALWPTEVGNGFILAERRGRVVPGETAVSLARLRDLPISVAAVPLESVWDRVLELARHHRLTAYDAVYLELALREQAPLATLDDDLAAAARREGVPLVEPTPR